MRSLVSMVVVSAQLLVGCAAEGPSGPATHDEVRTILLGASGMGTCAVRTCHGERAEANLALLADTDLTTLLVDVPACEAPSFDLVEPGDPDRSWLWIKLTAQYNTSNGDLVPDPSWGTPGTGCFTGAGFGKRMPRVTPYTLSAAQLARVRSWIEDGAPGPGE